MGQPEDFVILDVVVLIQCHGVTDGRTDTSTMAETREALHSVVCKNRLGPRTNLNQYGMCKKLQMHVEVSSIIIIIK